MKSTWSVETGMIITRIALLMLVAGAILPGCQMLQKAKTELMVEEVEGNALKWSWKGVEPNQSVTLEVRDLSKPEKPTSEVTPTGNSAWVRGLEFDHTYRFLLVAKGEQNRRIILAEHVMKIKEGEKPASLLTSEIIEFKPEEKLDLLTVLSIPKIEGYGKSGSSRFNEVRSKLDIVSRRMAEICIGDTYSIGGMEEIIALEDTRDALRSIRGEEWKPIHGFAAPALLAVDLRLPEEDNQIPCQLSIRLFDISHPDNRDQRLWNRRPLIFEDFVEIEEFRPGDKSNYAQLIAAMQTGLKKLCCDPIVRRYRDCVMGPKDEGLESFYQDLWMQIGVSLNSSDPGKSYQDALALMFPPPVKGETAESGMANDQEQIAPSQISTPDADEGVRQTTTEDKPPDSPGTEKK